MSFRIIVALATVLDAASMVPADAHSDKTVHHRHHHRMYRAIEAVAPAPSLGGRLVTHPAWNIACMTRDRATRALPCDQPVWVYGSPCEVDLGLGRYRPCD